MNPTKQETPTEGKDTMNHEKAAAIYSMNNGTEFAYELTYSFKGREDYKVRAVVMADGMMRVEVKTKNGWKANKPYIVKKNSKRNGDRIVEKVKAMLSKTEPK